MADYKFSSFKSGEYWLQRLNYEIGVGNCPYKVRRRDISSYLGYPKDENGAPLPVAELSKDGGIHFINGHEFIILQEHEIISRVFRFSFVDV
jgi:hypothetical protein